MTNRCMSFITWLENLKADYCMYTPKYMFAENLAKRFCKKEINYCEFFARNRSLFSRLFKTISEQNCRLLA